MSAPPRVALDAHQARSPAVWGSSVYTRELARALAARDDVDVQALAGPAGRLELAWEQLGLPRRLRAEGFDAVHAPNCFLPLRRPCPGVVTVHDLAFEEHPEDFARLTGLKFRALAPRAARSAERVICVSRFTADDVRRRYGVDEARLRVVLSAPALPLGDAEPPPGPYLLAVGALRPKKNLRRLVEAFRALWAEGVPHRLVLAGADLGEGAALRAAAGDAPVELAGAVTDRELDALMRGAGALVHPSLYEGFGLAAVEAMARGVPVALARATALPEAGGDAPEYFDPLDAGDIAATVRRVLEDGELRTGMVERGRARVAELSWEATAAATAEVYREAIAEGRAGRRPSRPREDRP
jgi:glycosyltransferase involved in cell wall biosynthesis